MRTSDDLSRLVNQSGFPLQMAVEQRIDLNKHTLGWKVLYREHGWKHVDGQAGFIDLVLEDRYGTSVLVVECKRVLEADWLFLCDSTAKEETTKTRLWVSNTEGNGQPYSGYMDARSQPKSVESAFCVVAGQDAKARPMLERLAAEVCASTEALAIEERPTTIKRNYGLRLYMPVVNTTARLHVSHIDPSGIELASGEAASISHEEVPWVRFRKQLSQDFAVQPKNLDWDFGELARAKEKQVFVVQVESLLKFLDQWAVSGNSLRLPV